MEESFGAFVNRTGQALTGIDMATQQIDEDKLKAKLALVSLHMQWQTLNQLWDKRPELLDACMTARYPFTERFDILATDVEEWVKHSVGRLDA